MILIYCEIGIILFITGMCVGYYIAVYDFNKIMRS